MAYGSNSPKIRDVAREELGLERLSPGREEAVEAILAGRDALVVQPTGSAKPAICQIAGLLLKGATVVVSPLIALQKDQVDSIQARKPAEALAVNSTKGASEIRETWEKVEGGAVESIFPAPEQLRKPETMERLAASGVLSQRKLSAAHPPAYAGAVEMLPHGRVAAADAAHLREAAARAAEWQSGLRDVKRKRWDEMRDYVESAACRRESLLGHMGDEFHGPCG